MEVELLVRYEVRWPKTSKLCCTKGGHRERTRHEDNGFIVVTSIAKQNLTQRVHKRFLPGLLIDLENPSMRATGTFQQGPQKQRLNSR
mmetsp:Transcript_751/g.1680  ORF Transcript_751/g.1680 Transcript_751/m.1680 type:complete len:88 (-) Transcript_751:16-279(-)